MTACFPDAVQREAVRRCSGIVPNSALVTIPGLQRTIALRSMLRCAREKVTALPRKGIGAPRTMPSPPGGAVILWPPAAQTSRAGIMHSGIGDAHPGIGGAVRRKEDLRLVTGRGRYSDDLNFPGQAYAAMVRSPHAHARIREIDTAAARAMPGVLAVLTGEDAVTDGLKRIPHLAAPGTAPDIVLHNRDGSPVPAAPHYVLPTDRVRHVGTAVACVIAETIVAAKDAAEKVIVDYEPLPVVTEGPAGAESDAAPLHHELPNVMIDAEVGDPEATAEAFKRAAHVTRLDTWINRVTGVPMEPRAA